MNWELLFLLACPLMMLFCMKGMFSGNKDDNKAKSNVAKNSQNGEQHSELQSIQIKMAELMEQNHELKAEIEALKEGKTDHQHTKKAPSFNEIEKNKNQGVS